VRFCCAAAAVVQADNAGAVNCVEPHPFLPVLATSGLADTAKVPLCILMIAQWSFTFAI
jgi:hypothetical protein